MMGRVHKALDEAFRFFEAVEDVDKRCEMMAKKAALFRADGDGARVESCADRCLGIWAEEMARKGE
jgi:anaphase-promoting complex subunit 5